MRHYQFYKISSLKYQRSSASGCKDKGNRKLQFEPSDQYMIPTVSILKIYESRVGRVGEKNIFLLRFVELCTFKFKNKALNTALYAVSNIRYYPFKHNFYRLFELIKIILPIQVCEIINYVFGKIILKYPKHLPIFFKT